LFASTLKRPALFSLAFLITGVLFPYVFVLAGGAAVCFVLYGKYRYWPVFLFLVFMAAGMWRVQARWAQPLDAAVEVTVQGRVLDVGGLTAGGNLRAVVRVVWDDTPLRVMVYVRPHLPRLEMGQDVLLVGEIVPLARAAHPGGYDAFLHLRAQKIDGIMWPTQVVAGEVTADFFVHMRRVRDALAGVFDAVLPAQEAGIIRAMVLGDREGLDRDLVEIYRVAGIRHVLSISGMHVTILTLFVNVLLGKILPARKAGLVTLAIMVAFCLMTGAAIATIRAVSMGAVLVFARVLHREYDLLTSISWACVGLLLYEPLMIYNVGFQLSFSAVFGIALLTAPFERLLSKLRVPEWGKFRNGVALSMATGFSTYIIFAHHFYEIPLYSVIANVLLLPFMMALVVMGVLTALVGLVSLSAAAVPGGVVFFVLRLYELVSRFFGTLPGALLPTGGGAVSVSLAGAAVLLAFAYTLNGFGSDLKRRAPLILFATAALLGTLYIRDFPPRPQTTTLPTFGEYTITRHHAATLVSGTGRGGEAALDRYLHRRNARAITLTLTQFPRSTDAQRLTTLLPRVAVLYLPPPVRPLPEALERAVEAHGIAVRWLTP